MDKPTYRVSVTTLEKFRRVLAAGEDNTWDTEAALYQQLTGTFIGTDKTDLGSAFHTLCEFGWPERHLIYQSGRFHVAGKFAFTAQQAEVAYQYKQEHPHMLAELPVSKTYEAPSVNFLVRGRVDGLEGTIVRDPKTRYSAIDVQGYLDSYQWRIYLDMLGLSQFYYDIFQVKSYPTAGLPTYNPETGCRHLPEKLAFEKPVSISCFAYPTMRRDVEELLIKFSDWVEARGYWRLLKREEAHAIAAS